MPTWRDLRPPAHVGSSDSSGLTGPSSGARGATQGSDAARYAEMERETPAKVSDFKGGDAVVYISSGAALVILIVLLIVLL